MKLVFTSLVSNQKVCLRSGSQKRHPDPKSTARSVKCESDADFVFLLGCVIHYDFVPHCRTVKKECYLKN
jgi:hypothetical protein